MKPFALSVKVIVKNAEGECLVLRRSASSKGNAGKWDFPGGKVEGEAFDEALMREVLEETGLEIELSRVVGAAQSESPTRRIAYLIMEARTVEGKVKLSEEHDRFAWVPPGRLSEMDLSPQFKAFVKGCVDDDRPNVADRR